MHKPWSSWWMEYGDGRATMIELDMVHVSYFGVILVKAVENLSNKISCLGLVQKEKPPGCQEQAAKQAGTPPGQARPSFERRSKDWPGRLGTLWYGSLT